MTSFHASPENKLASVLVDPSGQPVPLLGVDLRGHVFGAHARMVLRQRYRNAEKRAVEAIYTFPVPSDAALVGFAMETAGGRVEAEVKEREEAFQAYDDAVNAGHGAALLDEERRNVFTASVGNLLPGEETVIEVTYVQALQADEGALRLLVPTLVAPRYIPGAKGGDRTGHGANDPTLRVPDADRISPAIAAVSYGLSIDVLFDLGREVTIESPSHELQVSDAGDGKKRVRLRRDAVALDRDLVLAASGTSALAAGAVTDRKEGQDGTFALTVVPDLFDPSARAGARDVVFVVDVSGSMEGASIEQAKTALRLCLRHLLEGDKFQIIAFSDQFFTFEPEPVPFTQRTLEKADSFVERLHTLGGTEMLEPLLASVRAAPPREGRDRIVVLLTDGQVGNESEIVEKVAAAAQGIRVYTFGIGTNVSELLVNDLARRTRGAAVLIHPGERIDDKVTTQFARAIAARVTEVSIAWQGIDAGEVAPSSLPDLVDGEPWVVYGRYAEAGMGRVEIRGTLRGDKYFLEVPIELKKESSREGLAALWARARIRDLEEAEADISGRRAGANKKRIVLLSVEHGVASKYASFVLIEKRTGDRRSHGQPVARPIPVSAPAGWAMGIKPRPPVMLAGMAFGGAPAGAPVPNRLAGLPSGSAFGPPPGAPPPQAFAMRARAADTGAPPPPPPAMAAAPAPMMGAPSGVFGKAKQLVQGLLGEGGRPAALAETNEGSKPDAGPPATLAALFGTQLASGLFAAPTRSDEAELLATARALATCFAAEVDASHPMYGAQIKKAIDAILVVAPALLARAEREVMAALVAAYLVATGKRAQAKLMSVIQTSPSANVQALSAHLASKPLAHAKLTELSR